MNSYVTPKITKRVVSDVSDRILSFLTHRDDRHGTLQAKKKKP